MQRFALYMLIASAAVYTCAAEATAPKLVSVPFDFSHSAIGVQVSIKGKDLYMLLDTGVDPSVIDSAVAEALGLTVDRQNGGEAEGFGAAKAATAYLTTVDAIEIGDRLFPPFEALATDLTGLSSKYGSKLDGILGFSFLSNKIVLIDYPARKLSILNNGGESRPLTRSCRKRWRTALTTVESFPIIPNFRFGSVMAPVSLDTGSNSGVGLFQSALELPDVRTALRAVGEINHEGFQGAESAKSYIFDSPVGFGPFTLPPGQTMFLHSQPGSPGKRVANIGNGIPSAMGLTVMIDYKGHSMTFFGSCK